MNFARRFFSRPTALIGFAVFVAIVVIALAAPLLFARGPFAIVGMPLLPPSWMPMTKSRSAAALSSGVMAC